MAYDPYLVDCLRTALAGAADGLLRLGFADDDAADAATQAVRRARTMVVERWIPLIDGIRRCTALTGYRPVGAPDGRDLELVTVRAAGSVGWLVVTDPRTADDRMTAAEVVELAAILSGGVVASFVDSAEERTALAHALRIIASDPQLLTAFRSAFHGWAELLGAAAGLRAVADEELYEHIDAAAAGERRAQLDDIVAALAEVLPGPVADDLLETMPANTAAWLAVHLGLTGSDLAGACEQIVQRYFDDGLGDPPNEYYERPKIGDLLYPVLAADGVASRAFLLSTLDTPAFLWFAATDRALAAEVLAAGTRPGLIDAAGAGRVLLAHVAFAGDDGTENWEIPSAVLAGAIGPWLLQFSPLNGDWQATDHEKAAVLRHLLDDGAAAAALVGAMQRTVTGDTEPPTVERIRELAALVGMLGRLDVYEQLADARDARQSWDFGFDLIGMATDLVPGGSLAEGAAAALVDGVHEIAGTNGWLSAPSVCDAQRSADLDYRYGLAVSQAMLLTAYVRAAKADGALPATTPLPPAPDAASARPLRAWTADYAAWLDGCTAAGIVLPIGVATVGTAFVNDVEVGEEAAEIEEDGSCRD